MQGGVHLYGVAPSRTEWEINITRGLVLLKKIFLKRELILGRLVYHEFETRYTRLAFGYTNLHYIVEDITLREMGGVTALSFNSKFFHMKKFIVACLLGLMLMCGTIDTFAQSVTFDGKNFVQTAKTKTADEVTPFTYEVKGVKHPIYLTARNKCYIKRVSKQGKEYKQYLSREVTAQVLKALGR